MPPQESGRLFTPGLLFAITDKSTAYPVYPNPMITPIIGDLQIIIYCLFPQYANLSTQNINQAFLIIWYCKTSKFGAQIEADQKMFVTGKYRIYVSVSDFPCMILL